MKKPVTFWGIPLVFDQARIARVLMFQCIVAVALMGLLFLGVMQKHDVAVGMAGVVIGSTLNTIGIDFMKGGKHAIIFAFVLLCSFVYFAFF